MRIFLFRRSWVTAGLCITAAAVMLWVVSNPAAIGAAAQQKTLPIYSVALPGEEKTAAITFDAAWDDVRVRQFRKVPELPHSCFILLFFS